MMTFVSIQHSYGTLRQIGAVVIRGLARQTHLNFAAESIILPLKVREKTFFAFICLDLALPALIGPCAASRFSFSEHFLFFWFN
jgi:hypothetical protein